MIRIPPNGFSGFAQATPAAQIMQGAGRMTNGRARPTRRKKRRNGTAKVRTSSKRRRSSKPARLVKGSAAAKAYMAKIRRKRRR